MQILHQHTTRQKRNLFTGLIFGLWLLYYLLHPFEEVSKFPNEIYHPIGILSWMPIWMADAINDWSLLFFMRWMLVALCIGCMIPILFGWCAPLCCLLITFEQSYVRSYTVHVNHAEINLIYAAYLLTAFHIADSFLPKEKNHPADIDKPACDGAPLLTIALILCVTYYFVGMSRLYYGRSLIFSGDSMTHFVLKYTMQPSFLEFSAGDFLVRSSAALRCMKLGFVVITFLEVLAPLCLVSRRFRQIFLWGMIAAHLGIYVMMKISFHENILLMFVVLTDSGPPTHITESSNNQGNPKLTRLAKVQAESPVSA